jgi:hypothetical protein
VKGGELSVEQVSESCPIAQGREVIALILQILLETTSSLNVETTNKIAFDNGLESLIVETHEIFERKHTMFGE